MSHQLKNAGKLYIPALMALVVAGLLVVARGQAEAPAANGTEHLKVEHLEGLEPARETLSQETAKRLDIQTAAARQTQVNGLQRTVIPYAALIYDTEGATWVYLNTAPLTFVRHPVVVDEIVADQALLTGGLPSGSSVVTVGVAELFGAESEFEEE